MLTLNDLNISTLGVSLFPDCPPSSDGSRPGWRFGRAEEGVGVGLLRSFKVEAADE